MPSPARQYESEPTEPIKPKQDHSELWSMIRTGLFLGLSIGGAIVYVGLCW